MCQRGDLPHRLHGSGFIVGVHDRDQRGRRPQDLLQFAQHHNAIGVDWKPGYFGALTFQLCTGIQYRGVFNRAGDDVLSDSSSRACKGLAPRCRSMARLSDSVPPLVKNNFAGVAPDPPGNVSARRFQPLFSRLSEMMDTGRVARNFDQSGGQIAQHLRRDRRRRVVIEVIMLHLLPVYR